MRQLAGFFPATEYPDVLVGLGEPDDAAVYRLDDERALIKTTDFFTPVVDDPWTYGAIAAANAMSDVYAMGGEVLFALNIAGFPENTPQTTIVQIFAGGAYKVREAGAAIADGHTVSSPEPFYGLSVTGIVHLQQVMRKGGDKVRQKPDWIAIFDVQRQPGGRSFATGNPFADQCSFAKAGGCRDEGQFAAGSESFV